MELLGWEEEVYFGLGLSSRRQPGFLWESGPSKPLNADLASTWVWHGLEGPQELAPTYPHL